MGKECSQLFSVPIISDVEEMEGLWVDASPAGPRGRQREEEQGWGVGARGKGRWGQQAYEEESEEREQGHRGAEDLQGWKVEGGAG